MNDILKSIGRLMLIFGLGLVLGILIQPKPDYDNIDQLNKQITENLQEIEQLNNQLTTLYLENTNLLKFQDQINKENAGMLKELRNASISRKAKLELLNDYLLFIDDTLKQFSKNKSTGNRHSNR